MLAYTLRRLLWAVPTLWLVATLAFFGLNAALTRVRDDALDMALGGFPPPPIGDEYVPEYIFEGPLHEAYLRWLGDAVRLDWGPSFAHEFRPVGDVLREGFAITGTLGLLAFALAAGFGVPLGALAAMRRGWLDRAVSWGATLAYSVPSLVLVILLLALSVYAIPFRLFPVPWDAGGGWRNYLLPSLVLGVSASGYLARVTRTAVLEVLGQDYVRTARAKGLRERTVARRHVLRNALPTVLSALGRTLGLLLAGSLLVEYAYQVPGTGRLLLDGFTERDFPLIMAGVCLYTALVLAATIAADVAARMTAPRTGRAVAQEEGVWRVSECQGSSWSR
jgi:ABC-type dipeptide/oligopeptide/nickel transport system permease component